MGMDFLRKQEKNWLDTLLSEAYQAGRRVEREEIMNALTNMEFIRDYKPPNSVLSEADEILRGKYETD